MIILSALSYPARHACQLCRAQLHHIAGSVFFADREQLREVIDLIGTVLVARVR